MDEALTESLDYAKYAGRKVRRRCGDTDGLIDSFCSQAVTEDFTHAIDTPKRRKAPVSSHSTLRTHIRQQQQQIDLADARLAMQARDASDGYNSYSPIPPRDVSPFFLGWGVWLID